MRYDFREIPSTTRVPLSHTCKLIRNLPPLLPLPFGIKTYRAARIGGRDALIRPSSRYPPKQSIRITISGELSSSRGNLGAYLPSNIDIDR